MVNDNDHKKVTFKKLTESGILTSSAETLAVAKNKNAQRALQKDLAIISLEAKIAFKNQTAVINSARIKSAKFIDSAAIQMVRVASRSACSHKNSRAHTVPHQPNLRYAPASATERAVSLPELATRTRLYRTPKGKRPSTVHKMNDLNIEERIQGWIQDQVKFNSMTGIRPQNVLVT
ncbi:uncharacterized protein [Watersipora subatra]|uniref:uncharacterized protein n=1 Tax=Watersipora subatra TaxID=2589382 RepID=UPI00355B1201